DLGTGFLDRSVVVDGQEYGYQVYVPRAYDGSTAWPVTLFLHGAGERGDNGLAQTQGGLGRAIRLNPDRWPTLVVFPQVPEDMSWQGTPGEVALAALEATIDGYRVDESRVYLTGLSLGGNGTWYLAYHHPDRFAALVAVCGFVDFSPRLPHFLPESTPNPYVGLAERIKHIPIWIVHGDADSVVPVEESRRMAEALQAAGAEVHYEELVGVNHNAWDPAYASQGLATWLFGQRFR
ncbi:MAG: prolyl oligopeptidase family serine peptidase, partial [Gemmatimonadota bacterium]|nr:prolyl oligopeptidase family serine peptidase [Gemmatimonadota bacterium]